MHAAFSCAVATQSRSPCVSTARASLPDTPPDNCPDNAPKPGGDQTADWAASMASTGPDVSPSSVTALRSFRAAGCVVSSHISLSL
jgi:hypothetical protein